MSETDSMKDRFRELIIRLEEKTRADELAWVATTEDDCFQVHFSNFSVEIARNARNDNFFIRLYDDQGRIIEWIDTESLDKDWRKEFSKKVAGIYTSARRKALNVDKVFDDILAALA